MLGLPERMGHLTGWPKLLWSAEPPLQEEHGLTIKSQFAALIHVKSLCRGQPTHARRHVGAMKLFRRLHHRPTLG